MKTRDEIRKEADRFSILIGEINNDEALHGEVTPKAHALRQQYRERRNTLYWVLGQRHGTTLK